MIIKDTTSLKLMEEQSKLAAMGEMIGNIAHQWRQPLNIITTSASGLAIKADFENEISKKDIKDFADIIQGQCKYLSETIDDFKNFIKGNVNYLPISVKGALLNSLSLTEASIKSNYINLVTDIEDDLIVRGNENELQQAFINIINNSKDVLKELSELEHERYLFISTKKLDENNLQITITDNGGGIKEDVIGKIFEPYFTTKHKSIGTGLGLSMVDKIIRERHNGVVKVYNEEFEYNNILYKGARFIILLSSKE